MAEITALEFLNFVEEHKEDPDFTEQIRSKFPGKSDEYISSRMNTMLWQLKLDKIIEDQNNSEKLAKKNEIKELIFQYAEILTELKDSLSPLVEMLTDLVYDRIKIRLLQNERN